MMVKEVLIAVMVFLAASAAMMTGCVSQNIEHDTRVQVVTTLVPLGEFARMVGGERVDVLVLVQPGAEPHTFEPTPSQMKRIEDADLYVKNGAGLETWMDRVVGVNENLKVVDSSRGVELITGYEDHDHSAGETELGVDPHIWLSPKSAMIQVENIYQGLAEVDPEGKEYYRANCDVYLKNLTDLDAYLTERLSGVEGRALIVDHPAWSYLARDYGLRLIAIEERENEPGPKHLAELVQTAREENITTIFVEPQFNPKSAEVIARELHARVEPLDPLAEDYIANLKLTGDKIAESLGA